MPQWNRNFTYVNHETGEERGRYVASTRDKMCFTYFTLVHEQNNTNDVCIILSSTPEQAGRKCASSIFKIKKQMGQPIPDEIIFCMREYTRGSRKKIYSYRASRIFLNNPIQVNYHGYSVIYEHKTIIHKTPLPQINLEQLRCDNKYFIAYYNKKFKQPKIQNENNTDVNFPNISIPVFIQDSPILSLVIEV